MSEPATATLLGRLTSLYRRYQSTSFGRFLKFGIVGGTGVFVNMGVFSLFFYLLLPDFSYRFSTAELIGIIVSIFTNFVINDLWTWGDRPKEGIAHWFRRLGLYYLFASIAGAVQYLVAHSLHQWVFQWHEIVVTGIGIVCGILINFPFNNRWTFAAKNPSAVQPAKKPST